jgi:hypothetical protein
LNLWPIASWKSFFISHCSISVPSVRARQILSGVCGITRSTTIERVAGATSVMGPFFQQGFEAIEPVAPEGAVEAHPVDQRDESLRPGAVVGVEAGPPVAHQAGMRQDAEVLETAGCETPARSVSARTICSPSRHSRSKIARRVGSASVLKSSVAVAGMTER